MEALFEILLELVIQVVADVIADWMGVRRTPVTSALGSILLSALLGVALGGITIAVHPHHIVQERSLRLAVLLAVPFLNGLAVAFIGRAFAARGKRRSGFEYFLPAFVFSLAFGITRFAGIE